MTFFRPSSISSRYVTWNGRTCWFRRQQLNANACYLSLYGASDYIKYIGDRRTFSAALLFSRLFFLLSLVPFSSFELLTTTAQPPNIISRLCCCYCCYILYVETIIDYLNVLRNKFSLTQVSFHTFFADISLLCCIWNDHLTKRGIRSTITELWTKTVYLASHFNRPSWHNLVIAKASNVVSFSAYGVSPFFPLHSDWVRLTVGKDPFTDNKGKFQCWS